MKYLLDTCVISELIKPQPNPSVIEWIKSKDEENFYISVLTIAEIQKGRSKLPESKRKDNLQDWLDNNLHQRFYGRIFDISNEIAACWGKIQGEAELKGKKMSVIDSFIAATGIIFDCTVVTRNVSDTQESGCKVYNPWEK